MVCKGDLTSNWEFFKQQWQDYEVATGLDQKSQAIRVATFRSVMGKDCLQIFLNLNFGDEEITITSSLSALEDYFLPKRNVVYERYVFNSCIQTPEETVDGYVNRLRKLASSCQFGTLTGIQVIGIQDTGTKARLRGALGFSVLQFLLQKTSVFWFWWSLQFGDFSFFSIWFSVFAKNTSGFLVLVPDVVFGFSYFALFWVPVSVRFEQHLLRNAKVI